MAYPWTVFKTFTTGEILTAADLNSSFTEPINNSVPTSIDDYSANLAAMQSTADPYPASVESLATTIAGELERLRYLIGQITGEAQWYVDPDTTLASVATSITSINGTLTNIASGTTTFAGAKTFSSDVIIAKASPVLNLNDPGTGSSSVQFRDATTAAIFGQERSTGGALLSGSAGRAAVVATTGANPVQIGTNDTVRLTVAADGTVTIPGTISTGLTASRVVKTGASSEFSVGAVNLASTNEVTGTLPLGNGGTGITTKVMAQGTYAGNNSAGHTVAHGLGTTPDWVMVIQTNDVGGSVSPVIYSSDFTSTFSRTMAGAAGVNFITAVDDTNITLGSDASVNGTGRNYQFICFKAQ